ncbi:hypothetical protein Tco_0987803, partial [Tanacetum coccineum]
EMAPSGSNALLFDVHYDGFFMFAPLRYENGVVYELRVTKDKKYDYDSLCEFLKEKLEQRFYAMFLKLPECELDVGLKIVEYDSDLEAMYEFADAYEIIQMIHENRKKDAGNMSYEELVSWAEEEAQHLNIHLSLKLLMHLIRTLDVDEFDYGDTEEDNIVNKVVDKGKGLIIEEERPVPARKAMGRNKGIVIEENDNPNVMDSDSSDTKIYRLLIRKVEDEVIQTLGKVNYEGKRGHPRETKQSQCSDNEVGEKFVDAAQFKECLTYYGLANGYSIWCYRSSKTQIIALNAVRIGRPERIKDPKKGKLREDLELPTGNVVNHYFIPNTSRDKKEVVKDVMPHAEHRQCARHIYEGFRKHYSRVEFRNLFWAASKATYPGLFNKIMDKIKRANPNAYQYLLNKDPKTWSRAYFHIGTNCEDVENGFSECFNVVLVRVRNKPLITMLEAMRVIVMERMNTMRRMLDKWTDDICPNIQKRGLSIGKRGRGRGPRFGRLGARFGIHGNESDSIENTQEETMHDFEIQESQTVQTAPTQSSQTAASDGIAVDNQVVPVNEPVPREPEPRARRNFVIPRQRGRSERILKKGLQRITQALAAQRQILTVWIEHKLNSTSFVSLCCGIRQYDV